MRSIKKRIKPLVLSIKSNLPTTVFYHLIFYLFMFISYAIWRNVIILNHSGSAKQLLLQPEQAMQNINEVDPGFLLWFIFSFIILVIFYILLYSIFKGLIWIRLVGNTDKIKFKNYNYLFKYISRFFIINMIILIIFIIGTLFIGNILKEGLIGGFAVLIFILLLLHLAIINAVVFAMKEDKYSIYKIFKISSRLAVRLHKFIGFYLIAFIGLLILFFIGNLLEYLTINSPLLFMISFTLFVIIIFAYFGCARIFFKPVIEKQLNQQKDRKKRISS